MAAREQVQDEKPSFSVGQLLSPLKVCRHGIPMKGWEPDERTERMLMKRFKCQASRVGASFQAQLRGASVG